RVLARDNKDRRALGPAMIRPRQFSLGYLFLELFWVATSLGLFRAANYDEQGLHGLFLVIAGVAAAGAAFGGLFGNMLAGVGWTLFVATIIGMLLPAVNY